MKMNKIYLLLLAMVVSIGFTSCSDDDDSIDVIAPTGNLVVENQMLENNMLTISNVSMSQDGWVVIHRDNGDGGPMVPEIISVPKMVEAGDVTDVMVELKEGEEVEDGEVLWAMLHTDDGVMGTYEFNGTNGLDAPIKDASNNIMTKSFVVSVEAAPTGTVSADSQVLLNGVVSVGNITLDRDGYVVIHASNEAGDGPMVPEIISQPVYLEAGTYENVMVPLKETATVNAGATIWIMLHTDTGEEGVYEFDGENGLDLPIMDESGDIVMTSIEITSISTQAITGTLTVNDQALADNMISVGNIVLSQSGWVVVHASNEAGDGPVVPEIISEPVYLETGAHDDVEITFEESAEVASGDKVWVMLHNDTGVEAYYEFDGQNGLDLPITDASGDIVMTSITLE
ncbi:MAG: hypothetical protein R3209_04020 [Salinimicrobium sediminis]|nr:hypothetical protein [Salinimicrobium sediminis]